MVDMISVRIPAALKTALKDYAEENHYLDISEAVREYIRKKKDNVQDPYLTELQRLRTSISSNIKQEALRKSREQLVSELRKIDNQLKGDLL